MRRSRSPAVCDFLRRLSIAVQDYRARYRLSTSELGRKAGISDAAVRRVEGGTHDICSVDLVKLARAMDCTASKLLREAGL